MLKITHRDDRHIKLCYPKFGEKVRAWIEICHMDKLPVHLTQSFRFFGEQDELFKTGKSKARGGESKHNFFLAVDFCFDSGEEDGIQDPYKEPFEGAWKKAAEHAEDMGLTAGYFWKGFKDAPHIEAKTQATVEELRKVYIRSGKEGLFKFLDENESI